MSIDERFQAAQRAHQSNSFPQAEAAYRAILDQHPQHAPTLHLLGVLLAQSKRYAEAESLIQSAIHFGGATPIYLRNLGLAFQEQGKLDAAGAAFSRARQLAPNDATLPVDVGGVLFALKRYADAEVCFRQAIQLKNRDIETLYKLALCVQSQGRHSEAIALYEQVIKVQPTHYEAANNAAVLHTQSARIRPAISLFRHALQNPLAPVCIHSNLLLDAHYSDQISPPMIRSAEAGFFARWTAVERLHPQVALVADKRLRIGYVSPDFRGHSVSFFIEPILEQHDRERFEIYCYHLHDEEDEVSRRLQHMNLQWRQASAWSESEAAQHIVDDQIDILVDLAGHTRFNKVLMFRHCPAPIQISYLGYPDTTGLPEIPYRFSDRVVDPPSERMTAEKLLDLTPTYFCYRPPAIDVPVQMPPHRANGFITFGSFNNHAKLSRTVLELWIRILQSVPASRLVIKNRALGDTWLRTQLQQFFVDRGISLERIDLLSYAAHIRDHLESYHQVDVALDSYPYSGATTTCEALWMGVPVVTLYGYQHAGRMSSSILAAVGASPWIAASPDAYVDIAVRAAADTHRLADERASLRARLLASPVCDETGLTRQIENHYTKRWVEYYRKMTKPFDCPQLEDQQGSIE